MSSLPPPPPPAWHPDPTGRHQYRYWDGSAWTHHVSDNGVAATDPVNAPGVPSTAGGVAARVLDSLDDGLTVGNEGEPAKIQQQLHGTSKWRSANVGDAAFEGSGSILDEPILVVNQKAKLIELSNQFSVFNRHGQRIGAVKNSVGNIAGLSTSRTSHRDHRIKHLRGDNNRLADQPSQSDGALLDQGHLLEWELYAKITTGHHDSVKGVDDRLEVLYSLRLLYLRENGNMNPLFVHDATNIEDVI